MPLKYVQKNINYYSDSAMEKFNIWFSNFEIVPKKVQFLFHPIFWDFLKEIDILDWTILLTPKNIGLMKI